MTQSSKSLLKHLFLERYQELRRRLRFRLGSEDLADDAMQETYLRIDAMQADAGVHQPMAYLLRMALNTAEDQRRSGERLLDAAEVDELLALADELADPVRIRLAREQLEQLEQALTELPPRRRAILMAARVEELSLADIALRFGVSQRSIEKELRAALEYCCRHLDRPYVPRFGPGSRRVQ